MKNLSFRELSALGSALIITVVAALFLPDALMLARSGEVPADGGWGLLDKSNELARFAFGAVLLLIVLQIIYHAVIAALMRQEADEPMDERDRMVSLKATRAGFHFLDIGAVALVAWLFWQEVPGALAAVYLVTLLIAAEVVRYLAAFFHYRRSI